jgi:signal transduction histidine kinase
MSGRVRELEAELARERAARKEAEDQRRRLHELFRQSPAFFTVYRGPDHVIEFTSAESLRMFGRDTRGKPAREAMPEFAAQGIIQILDTVYATGEPFYRWELRALVDKNNDGHLVECFFNSRTQATRDASGKIDGIISFTVEITEQVRARRKLEEAVRLLQQERELRERFISALSHDLRTPLSVALMGAQVISRDPHNAERIEFMSQRVLSGLERVDQMIQELLDAISHPSGQQLPLELTECDLSALVASCIEELSSVHGGRFVLNAAPEIRGHWNCPGLRRIVENLATNAIKYGAPDAPVTITLTQAQERVSLAVHNEGAPVDASELEAIFHPYHRTAAAEQSQQKGWGIGLMLVRSMAEAHGGHVQVSSSARSGTTFTVSLPLDARRSSKTTGGPE